MKRAPAPPPTLGIGPALVGEVLEAPEAPGRTNNGVTARAELEGAIPVPVLILRLR